MKELTLEDELSIVTRELLARNPEATMWDLFKIMYEYRTGTKVEEPPAELEIIQRHLKGMSARAIAAELETETEVIRGVLGSCGFTAWRKNVPEIVDMFEGDLSAEEAANKFEMSRHMVSRILDEKEAWVSYCEECYGQE